MSATDPMLGRTLGERYRLLHRIGEGGMGAVYSAEHVVLGRRMAVKVLRPEYSTDGDLVRRFQREAVAASRIGQENIVDVIDFGRTREGNLYFVMEELPGASLASILHAEGPLDFARGARILAQVCRALGAAHAHGIVHRDLKPDNVLVMRRDDGSEFVKVVDFGISKSPGEGEERITQAGTIIGTPEYMAPEQGAAAVVDHRADIYAFGILAYEILTGTLPFRGESAIAILIEHQTKAPEPPSRRRGGFPPELERLILRALEKRPGNRQQSMVEVADGLSAVLASYGLPPVYDKNRTPPPRPAPQPGYTARFATPLRARSGETVEVSEEMLPQPSGSFPIPGAAETRPRSGGRLAFVAAMLAGLAVAAAFVATTRGRRAPAGAAPTSTPAPGAEPGGEAVEASVLADPSAPPARSVEVPALGDPPAPPARLRVTIRSDPPGADVYSGAEQVGRTPLTVALEPGESVEYRFVRGGFEPATRRVAADAGEVEVRLARRARVEKVPPRAAREVGAPPGTDENPYRKLDDLKPNPF